MAPRPQTVTEPATTEDTLLGGRVRLRQPERGFRTAIDPILLAAAVPVAAGERAEEFGVGVGAASLCLAQRVSDLRLTGFEIDPALAALARANAALNGFAGRVVVECRDVVSLPALSPGAGVDHVFANPPFWPSAASRPSADARRDLAVRFAQGDVGDWVAAAARRIRLGGHATWIFPASRLDVLVDAHAEAFGDLVLFPLWPRAGAPAKRVLLRARKGGRGPMTVAAGLVLHAAEGGFTDAAEAILRHGAPISPVPG